MASEPQPIIYNQPNWYVENVYQTVKNYVLPPEQQPLWVDVPSLTAHFIGRDAIVADLSARLTAGGSVALSAEGKPGVGKTTLAVALAHHRDVLTHFSDGVLWAGLGTQPDLPSRLARWANALGVDVSDRPTVEARAQAVRDAIGHRKLLLVIDDAWQSEATEHLRCGGPNCAHLLTSRDQRLALQFAGRSERVEELIPADALELLRRLAPKAVAVDEAQAAGLLAAVGYLPLAVELLGGYLAAGASARFADASRRRLALATRRLGDGTGKRMSLEEVITLSIDGLREDMQLVSENWLSRLHPRTWFQKRITKDPIAVFYRLGAFASKPARFDRAAAQAVAECDADALALLIDLNLLEYDVKDESLALHQAIADVARMQAPIAATTRHWKHYLSRVDANKDDWQTIEKLYSQIQWILQRMSPDNKATIRFVNVLFTYLSRRGLWDDYLKWSTKALVTAKRKNDIIGQSSILYGFGFIYQQLGETKKALCYHNDALLLLKNRVLRNRHGEGMILNNIGLVYTDLGEYEKALSYYQDALLLRRRVGDRRGEGTTLNNIGVALNGLGESKKALSYYKDASSLFRQMGDRYGEASTLNNIGHIYGNTGDLENSLCYYRQAIPLHQEVGDIRGEARTLTNIGAVYFLLGEKDKALQILEQTLVLQIQVGDRFGEIAARGWLANLDQSEGNLAVAVDTWEKALSIAADVRSPYAGTIETLLTQLRASQ
jgi:tetratricopeptide (TPR) repeat protein